MRTHDKPEWTPRSLRSGREFLMMCLKCVDEISSALDNDAANLEDTNLFIATISGYIKSATRQLGYSFYIPIPGSMN